MDERPWTHRVSPALDACSAEERAGQLAALTDALALRVMSALARADGALTVKGVADTLECDATRVAGAVEQLSACGLVAKESGSTAAYCPSPVAWQRFSRLFAPGVPRPAPLGPHQVDWSAYPRVIQRVADQMVRRYRTTFSREAIERHVVDSYHELTQTSVGQTHVPMMVNRLVTERLGEIAAAHLFPLVGVPEVLFVCVGNSGRSQIAEAAMVAIAGDRINVSSAGTRPSTNVDPSVVAALHELRLVPMSEPKELSDALVQLADYVVTMGCGDACTIMPGRRYLDWDVDDPSGRTPEDVRAIRDQIVGLVESLVAEIDEASSSRRD